MKTKSSKSRPLTNKVGDARELTAADFRRIRPMREADPQFIARWAKEQKRRGRPSGRTKTSVTISLDTELLASLRKSGKGWQTRINDLLMAAWGSQNK